MSAAATAAPAKDSAPNNITREKIWKAEIHTPAATYNANVPLDSIEPDPKNRDKISKEDVAKMAASIQAVGLLQPIVLRELGGGRYRIIAGEHRWRAHKELKLLTIRAMIYKDQSDLDAAKKKAVENAQRVDLTPIERAKRFRELVGLGSSQKEIGELFGGLSQPVVANALRLLELPADVQAMLSDGLLSEAHGVGMVRFAAWPRACTMIAHLALNRGDNSKSLNEDRLPFTYELVRKGLAYQICTSSYSGGYKLPEDFKKDPGFFAGHYDSWYLKPTDPKADKWPALKAKLDAEKAAAATKAEKKEGAKQSKMDPAAAAKRRKVIADNKQARAETTLARAAAFKQLQETKDLDTACLELVAQKAFAHDWVGARAEDVAKELGIALQKGFNENNLDHLAKLKSVDLLRLVTGCVVQKKTEDALRFASDVESEVAHVLGAKKTAKAKQAATDQLAAAAAAKLAKKKGGAK